MDNIKYIKLENNNQILFNEKLKYKVIKDRINELVINILCLSFGIKKHYEIQINKSEDIF